MCGLNAREKKLAAQMLRLASDEFGNHGCNDWDWPKDWPQEFRDEFARDYYRWNGDPESFRPGCRLPDFAVMDYLADLLEDDADV